MLLQSDDVQQLRDMVGRRLMVPAEIENSLKRLNRMLITLHDAKYLKLDPLPVPKSVADEQAADAKQAKESSSAIKIGLFGQVDLTSYKLRATPHSEPEVVDEEADDEDDGSSYASPDVSIEKRFDLAAYKPIRAKPTEELELLLRMRTMNPLFGVLYGRSLDPCGTKLSGLWH